MTRAHPAGRILEVAQKNNSPLLVKAGMEELSRDGVMEFVSHSGGTGDEIQLCKEVSLHFEQDGSPGSSGTAQSDENHRSIMHREINQSTPSSLDTPMPVLDQSTETMGPVLPLPETQDTQEAGQDGSTEASRKRSIDDKKVAEYLAFLKRTEDTCKRELTSRFRPQKAATTALLQGIHRVSFRLRAIQEDTSSNQVSTPPSAEMLSLAMLMIRSSQKSAVVVCCGLDLLDKVVTGLGSGVSESEALFVLECIALVKIGAPSALESYDGVKGYRTYFEPAANNVLIVPPEVASKILQLLMCLCASLDLESVQSPQLLPTLMDCLIDLVLMDNDEVRSISIGALQLLLSRVLQYLYIDPEFGFPPHPVSKGLAAKECVELQDILACSDMDTSASPTAQSTGNRSIFVSVAERFLQISFQFCSCSAAALNEEGCASDLAMLMENMGKDFETSTTRLSESGRSLSSLIFLDIVKNVVLTWVHARPLHALLPWFRSGLLPYALQQLHIMTRRNLPLSVILRVLELTGRILMLPDESLTSKGETSVFGLLHCPEETAAYLGILQRVLLTPDTNDTPDVQTRMRRKRIVVLQFLIEHVLGNRAAVLALVRQVIDTGVSVASMAPPDLSTPVSNLRTRISQAVGAAGLRFLTEILLHLRHFLEATPHATSSNTGQQAQPPVMIQKYFSFSVSKNSIARHPISPPPPASPSHAVSTPKGWSEGGYGLPYVTYIPWLGNKATAQWIHVRYFGLREAVLSCSPSHHVSTAFGVVNTAISVANWWRSRQWLYVTGSLSTSSFNVGIVDEYTAALCGLSTTNPEALLRRIHSDQVSEAYMVTTSALSVATSVLCNLSELFYRIPIGQDAPWIAVRRPQSESDHTPMNLLQPCCRSLHSLGQSIAEHTKVSKPEFWEAIIQTSLLSYTCGDFHTPFEMVVPNSHEHMFTLALRMAIHAGSNLKQIHLSTLSRMAFMTVGQMCLTVNKEVMDVVVGMNLASRNLAIDDIITSLVKSLMKFIPYAPAEDQFGLSPPEVLEPSDDAMSETDGNLKRDLANLLGLEEDISPHLLYASLWPSICVTLFKQGRPSGSLASQRAVDAELNESWLMYQIYIILQDETLSVSNLEQLWRCVYELRTTSPTPAVSGLRILQLLFISIEASTHTDPGDLQKTYLPELLFNVLTLTVVDFSAVPAFIEQALEMYGVYGIASVWSSKISQFRDLFWNSTAIVLAVACHLVSQSGFGLYNRDGDSSRNRNELIIVPEAATTEQLDKAKIGRAAFGLVEQLLREHSGTTLRPTSSLNIISRCLLCLSDILGSTSDDAAQTEKDLIPLKSISLIWQACDSLSSTEDVTDATPVKPVCVGGEDFRLLGCGSSEGLETFDPQRREPGQPRWPLQAYLKPVVEDPENLLYRMAGELTKLASDERVAVRLSAIKSLSTMLALRAKTWTSAKWQDFFLNLYRPIIKNAHARRLQLLKAEEDLFLRKAEELERLNDGQLLKIPEDLSFGELQAGTDAWDETLVFCVESGLPRIDVRIIDCVLENEMEALDSFYPSVFTLVETEGRLWYLYKQAKQGSEDGQGRRRSGPQITEPGKQALALLSRWCARLVNLLISKQALTYCRCLKWLLRWSMLPKMEVNRCSRAASELLRRVVTKRSAFERMTEGSIYLRHSLAIKSVGGALDMLFIDGLSDALTRVGHYLCVEKRQDLSQLDDIVKFKLPDDQTSPSSTSNPFVEEESVNLYLKLLSACLGIPVGVEEVPPSASEASVLYDQSPHWMDLTKDACEEVSYLALWDDELAKDSYFDEVYGWQMSNFYTPDKSCYTVYQQNSDAEVTFKQIDDLRNTQELKEHGCPPSIFTLTSFLCSTRFISGLFADDKFRDVFANSLILRFLHPEFFQACCEEEKIPALTGLWSQVVLWFVTKFQRAFLTLPMTEDRWAEYKRFMNPLHHYILASLQTLIPTAATLPLCHRLFEVLAISLENELAFIYTAPDDVDAYRQELLESYKEHWDRMLSASEAMIDKASSPVTSYGKALRVFLDFVESAFQRQVDLCLWKLQSKRLLRQDYLESIINTIALPILEAGENSHHSILKSSSTWNAFLSLLHLCDVSASPPKGRDESEETKKVAEWGFQTAWEHCTMGLEDCVRTLTSTADIEREKSKAGRLTRVVGYFSRGQSKDENEPTMKEQVQRTISLLSVFTIVTAWNEKKTEVIPRILKVIAELMIIDDKELRVALRSFMLAFL
eukprot:Blabericola_migrator_1__2246@NODE_161_length_12469_cov_104_373811_g141_i0_p1_GENE_NODE_161_length_12469_cov_104_373811_g141_i0NODE_161_length_12469_cov_104_373811_g141_i0_p1_ORF_typecomplete_len2227_score354_75Mon2_C/PF16206_5/2_4e03Mon2_C/PF16206_5/0_003HEAT_EZ/PF13513_6/0_51HEAT_EZ/PF13513_6/9_7e03HEAT/PF02985_22/1_7e02HEAT/PF02985_22/7_6_NODE_161_length_12469_cov_104_373811_g141_i024699149